MQNKIICKLQNQCNITIYIVYSIPHKYLDNCKLLHYTIQVNLGRYSRTLQYDIFIIITNRSVQNFREIGNVCFYPHCTDFAKLLLKMDMKLENAEN